MGVRLRSRFWWESGFASLTGSLAVVSAAWPSWLERLYGVDPDHGDGAVEWLIVCATACATIALTWLARTEWRRARPARA
jgi:hypothetical protein